MTRIPDQLLEAVVFAFEGTSPCESGAGAGATGFLISRQHTAERRAYLVTNAHVIAAGGTTFRVGLQGGRRACLEFPLGAWELHPDGDDVAATLVRPEETWSCRPIPWESFVGGSEAFEARMKELNVGVGDDVVMIGRFVAHSGRVRNQPLARFGNIAMMPAERVLDGRGLRVDAYLVEMRSLSGFSGSPVFVYLGPGSFRGMEDGRMMPFYSETVGLIGIDTGHIELTSDVREGGSNRPVDPPTFTRQNTGMAIVSPVTKIERVLDLVDERNE